MDLEESFAFKAKFRIVSVPLIVVLNADGYLVERIGTIPVTVSDFINVLSPTIHKKTVYKGVGSKLKLSYPDFYRNYFFQRTPSTVDTLPIRNYLDTVSSIFDEMNWNIVSVFGSIEREYFLFAKNADSLTKLYGQEVGEKIFFLNQSITQKFLSRGDYHGYKLFLDQIINSSSVEKREGWVRTCAIREIKFLVNSAYDWELTKVKIKKCYDTYGGSSSLFTLNYIYNTDVPVQFADYIVNLFNNEPTINDYYDRQYEFGVICLKARNFNLARSFFEKSLFQCSDISAREKLSGEIVKAKVKYGMTKE